MTKLESAILATILFAATSPAAHAKIRVKPYLTADDWYITSDVECGNARIIERVEANHFALGPREDPIPVEVQKTGPISNYCLYVEIANLAPKAREITLDVLIPEWLIQYKFDYFLRKDYLLRSTTDLNYKNLPADRQSNLPDRVRLRIAFESEQRLILSTTPAFPYSEVVKRLKNLERESNGNARLKEIGLSAEGRAIHSLETGDKTKPRAVFTATLQPGEPSAWGLLAMARSVLMDPSLRRFQKEYDLAFVPMPNPDGVVDGSNNVNGLGEVALLGFSAEARAEAKYDEAKVLWKYLSAKPPSILVDFHFLSLPNHRIPRPYDLTLLYTDPERRLLATSLVRRLERLTGASEGTPIRDQESFRKHLLACNVIREWNTVATLYQNTGPRTSHQQAQENGIKVLRVALDPAYMRD
jgi:hypothetical protein